MLSFGFGSEAESVKWLKEVKEFWIG